MSPQVWGWNARGCSSIYLACEFAQGTVRDSISDGQVNTFVWWLQHEVLPVWPQLPMLFPSHADLDGTPAYGGTYDGKSDVFPRSDIRVEQLRNRILARLNR